MGKVEEIMYPCRYWRNSVEGDKRKQGVYSEYSEYDQDVKPDIGNKDWQTGGNNGMCFYLSNK